ncbi:hypothetical protein HBI14_177620 [Parastagonospora nodorum]|nr:hypothetical protein HBI14_177620 [Parastagonospora nodorum]
MLAKSSSVISNRSIALITNKFSIASLTKLAILNNANIILVDAVIDALMMTLIKDDDDLLGTVNSYIKLRRLRAKHLKVCEADASKQVGANVRERENKNCSSLYYSNSNSDTATKKTRIKAYSSLDSDDYCLDSSLDINSKDNSENEEATTAKDLDSLSARVEIAIEHCTLEE